MNPVSQPDIHPDAEILNAFAEQALAERERARVLAHLARCGRCRQVVYLAQGEAEQQTAPQAGVTAIRREPQTASRLWNWRIAWAPVAALAGVVALAVLMHVRHRERSMEMAGVAPQSVPQREGAVSKPSLPERAEAAAPPATPVPAAAGERNRKTAKPGAESEPPPLQALASAAFSSRFEASSQSKAIVPSNAFHAQAAPPASASEQALPAQGAAYPINSAQVKSEPPEPEPAETASQQEQELVAGASSSHAMAAKQTQARTNGAVFNGQASQTLPHTASAPQLDVEPVPPVARENTGQRKMAGMATARITKFAPLPSGQTAVSTATVGHLILAIDSAGTLFLSQDSGSTWEHVAKQWSGRAVAVGVRPALSSNTAAAPSGASAAEESTAGAPSAAATILEIVNDKGRIWLSTDGETWIAQ
jgi:hypothetical protein